MKSKILALAMVLLYASSTFAGEEKRGTAGFMFLKVPMGAREVSMGQSGITTSMGANAIYWNPANVSMATGPSFQVSYLNHFAGISTNYAALSFPMSDIGTFGLSFNYLSYGDITKTDELHPDGNIGNYSAYDLAFGFTYSKQITDRVNGGMTVKFLKSHIDQVDASAYAFDFGFTYNTDFKGLKMSFVVSNLGPQSTYSGDGLLRETTDPLTGATTYFAYESEPFNLPAAVNFGLSMDLMRNEQNSVTGMLEQNVNSFQVSRTNFGLEYGFQNMFFARAGYSSALKKDRDYNTGNDAGMSGLTMGAGVDYKFNDSFGATVDYGYLNMGLLGGTHRFSVGLKF
ncbi:MAG TPA: PorV/PorQ family protein [bacterium]|nr:PorV/PorQ family protein [bacterium]